MDCVCLSSHVSAWAVARCLAGVDEFYFTIANDDSVLWTMELIQTVRKDGTELFRASVLVVLVSTAGKPLRLPAVSVEAFGVGPTSALDFLQ